MVFQPAIGVGGLAGWRILERTQERQVEAMEKSPTMQRNIEYFRDKISTTLTAEALVNDRRLLTVALGAYGLSSEINKKAYVQKVLEEGTQESDAFANRINDPRWRDFANAFDYGNATQGSNVLLASFREDVIARYKTYEFENAVGNLDNDMRLALNFKREIANIATSDLKDSTLWFKVMGQKPVRELVSTAMNIPTEVSQLDLDQQQKIFADKAEQIFGDNSPKMFADSEKVDEAIRRFFLIRQTQSGPSALTPGMGALTMLQSSALGASSLSGLFLSQG